MTTYAIILTVIDPKSLKELDIQFTNSAQVILTTSTNLNEIRAIFNNLINGIENEFSEVIAFYRKSSPLLNIHMTRLFALNNPQPIQ